MVGGINNMSNLEYAAGYGVSALKKRDEENADVTLSELFAEPEEEKKDILAQLQKSMKEFEDAILTGETEKDRKKMHKELHDYLEIQGIADKKLGELTKEEAKDLNNFIRNLMKKYSVQRKAEDFGDFFLPKNDNAFKYKYGGEKAGEDEKVRMGAL